VNARTVRGLSALVLVAAAVVWILLDPLPWPARALTTLLLVPLPVLLLLQARLIDQIPADTERESVYVSSAFSVWLLAALAMLTARYSDLTRADLGLVALPPGPLLLAAGLTVLGGLAIMALGRVLHLPESALVDYLIPRSGSEKIAFAGLSISAGIAEELVFRSFLIAALLAASGSIGVAAAVSVAAFAISHAYQGWTGVVRVAVLGLTLTAPLIITGSVYPSMIAHAILDLLAGLVLADWLGVGSDGH
jgi:uncharacterized protein